MHSSPKSRSEQNLQIDKGPGTRPGWSLSLVIKVVGRLVSQESHNCLAGLVRLTQDRHSCLLHDLELGVAGHFLSDVEVSDGALRVRKVLSHACQRSVVSFKNVSLEITNSSSHLANLVDCLVDDCQS